MSQLTEYLVHYDDDQRAPSPHQTLLDYLQSTYEDGAELAGRDRRALERQA